MEPEGSSPCSQKPATTPYSEPNFTLHLHKYSEQTLMKFKFRVSKLKYLSFKKYISYKCITWRKAILLIVSTLCFP
jgi:hypothetical protein